LAKDWFESLDHRNRKRAEAGLDSVSLASASGRGFAGRMEKIEGSKPGIFELKLTRGGTRGPQLRLLGVWRGQFFYAALGVIKKGRSIKRRDIERAETIIRGWVDDPKRTRPRKRST
jgi:hypothetical protein